MNKAILIGNLAIDPKFSHVHNGLSVTKFNMATSER